MGGQVTCSSSGVVDFLDGTGGTTKYTVVGNPGVTIHLGDLGQGILSSTADAALCVARSISGTLIGTVWGTEE